MLCNVSFFSYTHITTYPRQRKYVRTMKTLELLAPAKNYEQGIAAINHGADAVYIGAPQFGARAAAGNSLSDIQQLIRYAHIYRCKVFVTLNTVLYESEVSQATTLIWELYERGADAIIIQDMGLLEADLPPIELHASTQMHNVGIDHIRFLEQVGLKRIILARETTLDEMRQLRQQVNVDLEAFVQGALCVCYSGQCYMSAYLTGRSGNRGCCAQPCRNYYNLRNEKGSVLRHHEHLLSLRDFSAANHLADMVEAGITSFKIEGRLKDMAYVKNVTAYYRRLLDSLMSNEQNYCKSSVGDVQLNFTPDLNRTFNRGFTDYFLEGKRQPIASLSTGKAIGQPIGTVRRIAPHTITIRTDIPLSTGDGLCYIGAKGQPEGFKVNHVNGATITPNHMPSLSIGTMLWRNYDHAFQTLLEGETARRTIPINLTLNASSSKLTLRTTSLDGTEAQYSIAFSSEPAQQQEKSREQIIRNLSKLGNTPFVANHIELPNSVPFVPISLLNELRRKTIELMTEQRAEVRPTPSSTRIKNTTQYHPNRLPYQLNITNDKAEHFYHIHGVETIERGLDETNNYIGKHLMTTKYCLRYELGQCLQQTISTPQDKEYKGALFLVNNNRSFALQFDCEHCRMHIDATTPSAFCQETPHSSNTK